MSLIRAVPTPFDDVLFRLVDVLRGHLSSSDTAAAIVVSLVLLRRLDDLNQENVPPNLAENDLNLVRYPTMPSSLAELCLVHDVQTALAAYIGRFNKGVVETLASLDFSLLINRLPREVVREVLSVVAGLDLTPGRVSDETVASALDGVLARFGEMSEFAQFHTPRDVTMLLCELLVAGEKHTSRFADEPCTVADPCCGTGGLLVAAAQTIERYRRIGAIVGWDVSDRAVGMTRARLLLRYPRDCYYQTINQGNTLSEAECSRFEYLVANPPFGASWKRFEDTVLKEHARGSEGRFCAGLPTRSDSQFLFIQDVIARMRPTVDGGARAVVITSGTPLFSSGLGEIAIRRWLLEMDVIEAIIELPARAFSSTSIATFIWLFSNRKPQVRRGNILLFDAAAYHRARRKTTNKAVDMDDTHISDIVRTVMAGVGTDIWSVSATEVLAYPDARIPAPRIYAERESLNRYVQQFGGRVVRLRDLAVRTVFGRRNSTFEDAPNSIFLPLIGTGRVLTSASALTARPENYAQVVLDDRRALSPYVAEFLNSDRGKRLRQNAIVGVLPRITRAAFDDFSVIVPEVVRQVEVIDIDTSVTDAISSLNELRTKLWAGELSPADVSARLPTVREREFPEFIETLPYPLATILWRYYTARTDGSRVEELLNFFEALAQLYCILLLSIAERDHDWFEAIFPSLRMRPFDRPTFGTWVTLAQRLAPVLARLFDGTDEDRRRAAVLFGTEDSTFPRRLLSSDLLEILTSATEHRNDRAHGGINTAKTSALTHELLRSLLASFRSKQGAVWGAIRLLRPGPGSKRRSRHSYDATVFLGSRTPFPRLKVEAYVALDAEEVHADLPGAEPLVLVPLLRIGGGDGAEACHFFNRIDGHHVRFVSYHSTTSPSYAHADEDVLKYVVLLNRLAERKANRGSR